MVGVGDSMFKQKKKRFFTLIQLSEYKFLFCSYQPGGTQPKESLQLDQGMTVEYTARNGQYLGGVAARPRQLGGVTWSRVSRATAE